MQNLKITKNTNNSPTLKINIVLNVQNIKEIKGFEDFPEWCGQSFGQNFYLRLTFHAIHLNHNKGELNKKNKNQIKNKNKKLKVRNWVAFQKALDLQLSQPDYCIIPKVV